MSRRATKWAYGNDLIELGFTANELALLRAICWKYDSRKSRTDPITNADLTRYTGIKSPDTLNKLRKRLKKRGFIGYKAQKEIIPDKSGEKTAKTANKKDPKTYVYSVNEHLITEMRLKKLEAW